MSSHEWVTKTYNGKELYRICVTHGTDHGRVMNDELEYSRKNPSESSLPALVSFGCENPTDQQAEIFPWNRYARRHPYSGNRPQWSGYCTNPECRHECHDNEPQELKTR
jgi:hypothetical protein